MKELRFSIQCGASNRKALVTRRCSQCTVPNDDLELNEYPQQHQLIRRSHSNRSSSSVSTNIQPSKRRSPVERTSDADKFDTLLMLAAERTNYLDTRRKHLSHDNHHHHRKHRHLSSSPPRKDVPLVLIEQDTYNNPESSLRSHQVRFSNNTGKEERNAEVINEDFFDRFIGSK